MPMSYAIAITRAAKLAQRHATEYHVVWDCAYFPEYPRQQCYDTASDYDLETFYAGLNPVATLLPDGSLEH